jgi:hypothetical protein
VRITLPRASALSAVLILPVACGGADQGADKGTAEKAEVKPTLATPTPVEVTKKTFAPRVLAALDAKGSFRAEAAVLPKGAWEEVYVTANVRMTETGNDVAVLTGGPPVVRVGDVVYLKDHKLTGSTKRPWAKLNLRSEDPAEREAVLTARALIGLALAHQVIGGTAYATDFKRGGQLRIDGVDEAQEYIFTIDLRKAVAAGVLGELLNRRIKETVPKGLSVSVSIDANDVPRRIEYVLTDGAGLATHLMVILRDYGKKLPITAPAAATIGTVKTGKGQVASTSASAASTSSRLMPSR